MDVGQMTNLLGPININYGGSSVAASGISGVDSTGASGGAGRAELTAEWTGDGDWQTGEFTLTSDH